MNAFPESSSVRVRRREPRRGTVLSGLFAVALLVSGVVTTVPAYGAPAQRVTFGIEPSAVNGPNGFAYFSYGVTPGAFVDDHVALVNYSAVPLRLSLYGTDAVETLSGGFGLLLATQRPSGVGSWISLAAKYAHVIVPPRRVNGPGIFVVPFTMRVPITTTPGDHVGGIVASLRTRGVNSSGQNIILDQRIGTRVFVRVAGQLHPSVQIRNLHATYFATWNPFGSGRVRVSYQVLNSGNVDLSLSQSVNVTGALANSHHVALANVALLLSGSAINESVVVGGVWPQFIEHVGVSVKSQSATSTLVPLQSVNVNANATVSLWTIPWPQLIFLAVVVAALFIWRRRHSSSVVKDAS